jgi:hypothetical protein
MGIWIMVRSACDALESSIPVADALPHAAHRALDRALEMLPGWRNLTWRKPSNPTTGIP